MDGTACTEPQYLYRVALYLNLYLYLSFTFTLPLPLPLPYLYLYLTFNTFFKKTFMQRVTPYISILTLD